LYFQAGAGRQTFLHTALGDSKACGQGSSNSPADASQQRVVRKVCMHYREQILGADVKELW